MNLYLWYQEKIKEKSGEMSLEQLREELEADIERNQIMQSVQPGRYLEGEYTKWIARKQLKAFYEEIKMTLRCFCKKNHRIKRKPDISAVVQRKMIVSRDVQAFLMCLQTVFQ